MGEMIELHCRACKRSVDFRRTSFPDVPAWVARIEHDKCNLCDNGDFSAEHWIDADGREPIARLFTATNPSQTLWNWKPPALLSTLLLIM